MESAPALVAPDDIDVDFIPNRREGVVEVVIDDEMLLVGDSRPLLLNPTGALVWQCLDGEVSLAELIDDLTEGLSADPQVVRTDVLEFVRSLGLTGLLDGVGIVFEPGEFEPYEPTEPLDVGAELEPFALDDLDGNERSLAEWRERSVLVVNWSPSCGYCTMIAPHIAELQPHLDERAIDLVFVSDGDADANRAILADSGIEATVLLKGDGPDPFSDVGTPLAYLLDGEGKVATTAGWGANQALALLEDITGVALADNPFAPAAEVLVDETADQQAEPDDAPTFRYLPAPGGT